jgi:hypothetical protein
MLGDLHDGGNEAATDPPAEGSGRDDKAVEVDDLGGLRNGGGA